MPSESDLRALLGKISGTKVKGTFFRIVSHKRGQEIDSISASLMRGGRFNPPIAFGALYLGESEQTCMDEVKFHAAGDLEVLKPLTIGSFEVKLKKVLDLTDPDLETRIFKTLKINGEDLKRPGYHKLTRQIGRVAHELGFEGILFLSAASPGNKNLAVFPELLEKNSVVKTMAVHPLTD